MRGATVVWGIALAAMLQTFPCAAQLAVTPSLGLYLPMDHIISECGQVTEDSGLSSGPPSCPGPKQNLAPHLGARLTEWVSPRFGLDLSVGYTPSGLTMPVAVFNNGATSGDILTFSARFLVSVNPHSPPPTFYLAAGPALITRGGGAYQGISGVTAVGGDVGIGARLKARNLDVRVELENYVYSFRVDARNLGVYGPTNLQNDLVLSVGPSFGGLGRLLADIGRTLLP